MPSCCGSLVPPSTATEYNLGLAGFTDSGCPGVSRGCGRGGGAGCVQARVHLDALEAVRLREQLDEALGESKFERAVRVLDDVARRHVAGGCVHGRLRPCGHCERASARRHLMNLGD